MSLKFRSHRFLSRSLAMAVAALCGLTLSSVAQAQIATGSGCTNCGTNSPVVTYSAPVSTQYSQPIATQSYPAATAHRQSYSSGCCASTPQRWSTSHRRVAHYRHSKSACQTRTGCHRRGYSSGWKSSGCNSYPASNTYSGHRVSYATPVMQTGAGCASGNCR